ncbi:helix-turn-helix domain-containing protein [Methylobacterium frigidaeris]|uniref:HTH cro/C1-type domain-containing protein n=1 Tax=Methylobacterium frigidaeris TaxID=2038277 RepID=A0AA37H6J0_9HYPH|nr:helix-turn-helix transcriptional regulator [Methylobacterium frigidaeris]GJD60230.1 hypothetical protein MPEAHAMD_0366 [Methylobacterium frigidaeris]
MSSSTRDRAVSERIVQIRKRRRMTQVELADRARLARGAVSGYERGGAIPHDKLARIAAALEVDVGDLAWDAQALSLSRDEADTVRTLRTLPAEGRAYIGRLMADLARREVAR